MRITNRSGLTGSLPFDPSKLDINRLLEGQRRAVERVSGLNGPITRVISVPRARPLGGCSRVVREWEVGDLAEMQAFIEESAPHPMDALPPEWADPDPGTRPARIKAAWEASQSWPPRLWSDEGDRILGSAGGRAYLLSLNLARHNPGFGAADALQTLAEVTPAQWAGFHRVAWAITPRAELLAELAPDRNPASPTNWFKAIHDACVSDYGPGIARGEFARLTLSEWAALFSDGRDPELQPRFAARCRRAKQILEGSDG